MTFHSNNIKQNLRLIIIIFALGLIIVLLISALRNIAKQKQNNSEPEAKVEPVLEQYNKCYVINNDGNKLTVLYDNNTMEFLLNTYLYNGNQQIIDLYLTDGKITKIIPYENKINEKLISIKSNEEEINSIELDRYGLVNTSSDFKIYNIMGEIQSATENNLTIGYNFSDYVLNENNEIVAALIARKENMEQIRVLIKNNDFESVYHDSISLKCDTAMDIVREGNLTSSVSENSVILNCNPETELTIANDSELFQNTNRILLRPNALSSRISILSLNRNQGTPSYRGLFEIEKTDKGLIIVNELPLEEYLYSVVPSEMPASYPKEALKAQAVCARTYAYTHMLQSNLQNYGAHLDDSTAYQVYNNIEENPNTSEAVSETSNQIIMTTQGPAVTYFYSTSCGYGTNLSAWNLAYNDEALSTSGYLKAGKIGKGEALDLTQNDTFDSFIKATDQDSFEKSEKYYRWFYETPFDPSILLDSIKAKFLKDPEHILTMQNDGSFLPQEITDPGIIRNISVYKRTVGGVVTELLVEGSKKTYLIQGENNIRNILANESNEIKLDSSYSSEGKINGALPSAFLTIELKYEEKKKQEDNIKESKENRLVEQNYEIKTDEDNVLITGYAIYGGGYGHGIGMSQNGAKDMAQLGYSYKDILDFFYNQNSEKE